MFDMLSFRYLCCCIPIDEIVVVVVYRLTDWFWSWNSLHLMPTSNSSIPSMKSTAFWGELNFAVGYKILHILSLSLSLSLSETFSLSLSQYLLRLGRGTSYVSPAGKRLFRLLPVWIRLHSLLILPHLLRELWGIFSSRLLQEALGGHLLQQNHVSVVFINFVIFA